MIDISFPFFRYFKVIPSSCQDEKLLQSVFELLEQISYGLHLSTKTNDQLFFDWMKNILLNPFISLLASNKDFGEMRQTKRLISNISKRNVLLISMILGIY